MYFRIIRKLKLWTFWPSTLSELNVICLLGFYALIMFSPYYNFIVAISVFLFTVFHIFYFCHEGQILEDLFLEVNQEFYNLEWYRWDKKSSDLFKVLFTSVCTPFKINNNRILQVNHECFKQCMVMAYSMFNLVKATAFK
ncbi:uncharacterized protein [Euwallacea fornicatus]|uniref:uncharacterized protein n=1 Tax=Euwallacea fornicatus TaxID=995702 RepID=UPI0033907097